MSNCQLFPLRLPSFSFPPFCAIAQRIRMKRKNKQNKHQFYAHQCARIKGDRNKFWHLKTTEGRKKRKRSKGGAISCDFPCSSHKLQAPYWCLLLQQRKWSAHLHRNICNYFKIRHYVPLPSLEIQLTDVLCRLLKLGNQIDNQNVTLRNLTIYSGSGVIGFQFHTRVSLFTFMLDDLGLNLSLLCHVLDILTYLPVQGWVHLLMV